MSKTFAGNFFEDFTVGQKIDHATPRTVTSGDVALNTALYGSRFALQSSAPFARACGFDQAPVDDLLVFHVIIGKSVPDISINAVANLGYAEARFHRPVYPGVTLTASSTILGCKENSNGRTGIVYLRTEGRNQRGEMVLDYVRWVMIRKRDISSPAPETVIPDLAEAVSADRLIAPGLDMKGYDLGLAGSKYCFDDYAIGEKINHVDGMTVEAAEHMMATRLYQNTAKVHFNRHVEQDGRLGERIVYGGHVISLARSLSFNGLQNACRILAINGGSHVNPCLAGDTVYAWSEVLDKAELASGVGALRLRLVALKDRSPEDFTLRDGSGKYDPAVLLDFDYWAAMPTGRT